MSIFESTSNEMSNMVNLIISRNSFGYDEISPKLTKYVISEISISRGNIINLSLNTDKDPNRLKIARNIPIIKPMIKN